MKHRSLRVPVIAAVLFLAAACGSEAGDTASAPTASANTSVSISGFVDSPDCSNLDTAPLAEAQVSIGDGEISRVLAMEVASTEDQRRQGLMCRSGLADNSGMLFVFTAPRSSGFWMFNTYVPLEILYVRANGDVLSTRQMTPCTRDADSDADWRGRCSAEAAGYLPGGEYLTALELTAGWLESQGFDPDSEELKVSFEVGR